jgi:amidophosphoribosyltransferase
VSIPESIGRREAEDHCGLFGIFGHPDAVDLTYLGIYAQQHRGQESAGICSAQDGRLVRHAALGLVTQAFSRRTLADLRAPAAIGHVRYSTTGSCHDVNCQPLLVQYAGGQVAVAHNGNLINAAELRTAYEARGAIFQTTSDTEVILHLLASPEHAGAPDPLAGVLRELHGAYSLLFIFPDRIEAARDPHGLRPLCIGLVNGGHRGDDAAKGHGLQAVRSFDEGDATARQEPRPPASATGGGRYGGGTYVIASETCALDIIDAEYVRDVAPGEIVTLSAEGLSSRMFVPSRMIQPAHCIFELIYFANPSSDVFGQNVHSFRVETGRQLAREAPADADLAIPVPNCARCAAIGYGEVSRLPFGRGFTTSHYVGRSFILPDQRQRDLTVKMKLNVIRDAVRGKRLAVIEDSVVRGTTTKGKMGALRKAGAKEIHLRAASPPIRHPCYFGIDFPSQQELIACGRSVEEIRDYLEVDSLQYLSLEGLLRCARQHADMYCTACFSGKYPMPVARPVEKLGLERFPLGAK